MIIPDAFVRCLRANLTLDSDKIVDADVLASIICIKHTIYVTLCNFGILILFTIVLNFSTA